MSNETQTVYLDLETTGLEPSDEIIEIGILSDDGIVLLDTYVKPVRHVIWHDAQQVNDISPDDVKDAPSLDEIRPQIIQYIKDKTVVIYNASFDYQFLRTELEQAKDIKCCMLRFAPIYGEWHDYWENYTWQKLTTAANYVYFIWEGEPHSAINDCTASRAVWRYLTDNEERKRVDTIREQERQEQEIEWEVDHYLRELEHNKIREQEKFLEKANSFWTQRILGKELPIWCSIWRNDIRTSPVKQGNEHQKWEELEEIYHLLFTGFGKKIWDKLQKYQDLVVYREKKSIPKSLLVFSKIEGPDWILARIRPVAYFLSKSGKSFYLLYEPTDVNKIRAEYPNRYESWGSIPDDLKSKTRLKREHRVDIEKEGLKPVGDVRMYTPHGIEYVPLYRVPKETPKKRKATRKKTKEPEKEKTNG